MVKNREKFLAIAAGLAFGIFALDKLVLTPLADLWKERSAKILVLKDSIAKGSQLMERSEFLNDRWAAMKLDSLSGDISAAENAVFQSVNQWAEKSRLGFTSLKPVWRQGEEEHFDLFECRADGFGDLRAVTSFLYELETDPLALRVEDLEISARDDQGGQLGVSLRFTGLVLKENKS